MHQLYAPLKLKVVGKEPKTYLEKLLDILVGVHYYITLPLSSLLTDPSFHRLYPYNLREYVKRCICYLGRAVNVCMELLFSVSNYVQISHFLGRMPFCKSRDD